MSSNSLSHSLMRMIPFRGQKGEPGESSSQGADQGRYFSQNTDLGEPEKQHRLGRHAPVRQVEPSHGTQLASEHSVRLYNIWLSGAQNAKEAVHVYAGSLQRILIARDEQEMSQVVINAGETLKASIEAIINAQAVNANSIINNLPLSQQHAAMDYWGTLNSRLREYSDTSVNSSSDSIKHLVDMGRKLWDLNKKVSGNLDRVYDQMVTKF